MLTRRWFLGLLGALLLLALPALARMAYAHAVLVRAEPAANAQLTDTPHEIRLWFTEPLEPTYSSIVLRDATGATISTLPSYVEPTDAHQLVLMAGELPAGLYTVVWRNVSSADGHQQTGSYPFVIGAATSSTPVAAVATTELASFNMLARWVNFWGQALAVGSIAFMVLVLQPALRTFVGAGNHNRIASKDAGVPKFASKDAGVPKLRLLWAMVWVGWVAAGVGAVLLLLNQAMILLDKPLADVLALSTLVDVVNTTRFGTLWLWRMGLWLVMALLLLGASRSPTVARLATVCGLAMLLPTSMHSHAAVSRDANLSIFSDWVHLAMTALWVGGLVQFLFAIPLLFDPERPDAPKVGTVVAHFSNFARLAVAGLIVTGIYATWHQVNTLEALTTTFYGRLLCVKLILALLLLVIAGVNLVWTQRRLMAGHAVWITRLRALVSVEIFLVFGILLVVGAMTAVNPARNEIAQREAAAMIPLAPQEQPIHLTDEVDDLAIHFSATPGWAGNSTFIIQLVDEDGAPITDASLIRLRFEQQGANLGESELQIRPESPAANGVYTIEGANLSAVGEWALRMTVQRPDAFDAIADFAFSVVAPPPPPPVPVIESDPILPYRTPIFLLAGTLALLVGLYSLVEQRFRLLQGSAILGAVLVVLGAAFLVTGLMT